MCLPHGTPRASLILTESISLVIAIPAEVKHWHGAQKNSWFQHLTYHKDVQEGASNEWCEPVDDDTYNALK